MWNKCLFFRFYIEASQCSVSLNIKSKHRYKVGHTVILSLLSLLILERLTIDFYITANTCVCTYR